MPPEQILPCDDLQPWLAAYALGEAEEEGAARAHLATCPQCQHDLQQYRLVAGMLPYTAAEAQPSPELRGQVISAIEQQAAAASAPAKPRQAAFKPAVAKPRRARSFWAALAFAALALALLGWNVSLQRELDQQQAQVALGRQNWQTMIGLLNDTSLRWYALGSATPSAGQAKAWGHFWAVPEGQVACLVAQGLPELPKGQVYQVWLIRDGEQFSGATFEAHGGGAWAFVQADEPLTKYDRVVITIEPAGGNAWPTGPQVIGGDLAVAQAPSSTDRQELLSLLRSVEPLRD